MSISIDIKSFTKRLSKIIKSEKGIKKIVLVDNTGLTLASVSKNSYFSSNVDEVSSVTSAVFYATEEQGRNLNIGNLEIITSEFGGGIVFTSRCGPKSILMLISDPNINIGLIRIILRRLRFSIKNRSLNPLELF